MIGVELSRRESVPRWLAWGTPVLTVVAALAVSGLALVALGVDPLAAYSTMFFTTATTEFGVTETLTKAVPLMLTGLAVYLPLRAGLWNIGAEGQLYVGAIAGTWVGLNVAAPAVVLIPLMVLASGLVAGLFGGVPGYLRAKYDVNEIIVSLMLTFVGVELASYAVRGPMQGGQGNFPVSELLGPAASFPTLGDTSLHLGFPIAVLAVVCVYVLVQHSRLGFEVTVVGSNPEAARQAGMSRFWVYVFVFAAGGALAGVAGIAEVAGVQGRLRPDFSPGYGFTAIPIALLGRNGAGRVGLAAVFFALLLVGGTSMEIAYGVPAALVDVVQALVILFLITAEFFKEFAVEVRVRPGESPAADRPEGVD